MPVIEEAIKAAKRLDTFSTAVRIIEGVEQKSPTKAHYELIKQELKPLMTELGICERKELGEFKGVRDPSRWWY